jgi:hypothetical protein
MSTAETKRDLQTRMREWAQSLGPARPSDLRQLATALDDDGLTTQGHAYFASAEMLRLLAEQTDARTATENARLTAALARATDISERYQALRQSFFYAVDENVRLTATDSAQRGEVKEQADVITKQAREIAALTQQLSRAVKRHTALSQVVVTVLTQLEDDGVSVEFVYGDFPDVGIDPEVASDLALACVVVGKSRDVTDVHSIAGN